MHYEKVYCICKGAMLVTKTGQPAVPARRYCVLQQSTFLLCPLTAACRTATRIQPLCFFHTLPTPLVIFHCIIDADLFSLPPEPISQPRRMLFKFSGLNARRWDRNQEQVVARLKLALAVMHDVWFRLSSLLAPTDQYPQFSHAPVLDFNSMAKPYYTQDP